MFPWGEHHSHYPGMHLGINGAYFLRTEHLHKFGVAVGLERMTFSKKLYNNRIYLEEDEYLEIAGDNDYYISDVTAGNTDISIRFSPTYRVGHPKRYADASFILNVPVIAKSHLKKHATGIKHTTDEMFRTDIGYAVNIAGRYDMVGAGIGYGSAFNTFQSGGPEVLHVGMYSYLPLYGNIEFVPAISYFPMLRHGQNWVDGWSQLAVSASVSAAFR